MAMTPNLMANEIINNIGQSKDATDANNKFYKALCNYVENNAQVFYSWIAALPSPPYSPDPMVIIEAKIKTSGSLSPSGATDPSTAMSIFTSTLNANIATWQIKWPAGFALSPALVIPTVIITPSMATDQLTAMTAVCTQIISGIQLATPAASGSHASFIGAATFTKII